VCFCILTLNIRAGSSHACPLCCSECRSVPSSVSLEFPHPFLSFPAGVIIFPITWSDPDTPCGHNHREDGWHDFPGDNALLPCITSSVDADLYWQLVFLVTHDFIWVSVQSNSLLTYLFLRIFLPVSSSSSGHLSMKAGCCLQNILPFIVQSEASWNASDTYMASGGGERHFIDINAVSYRFFNSWTSILRLWATGSSNTARNLWQSSFSKS